MRSVQKNGIKYIASKILKKIKNFQVFFEKKRNLKFCVEYN